MKEIIELKYKDIPKIREELAKKQNGICPICKKEIKDPVLDHSHQKKNGGTGLCRGAICLNCNSILGKVENMCKRYLISNEELPFVLKNMSEYLQAPHTNYLHPTEKNLKITDEEYSDIKKYYLKVYPRKRVIPEYPKDGFINKNFKKILKDIKAYKNEQSKSRRVRKINSKKRNK